jgi:hypothetical protein
MATTTIAVTKSGISGAITTFRPAIVAANDHVFTPGDLDKCLVMLTNTTNATKVFTIHAGVGKAASIGNRTVSLAAGNGTAQVAVLSLDPDRFLQANGTVKITVAADTTGFIQVVEGGA